MRTRRYKSPRGPPAGFALPGQAQALAVPNAWRNLHFVILGRSRLAASGASGTNLPPLHSRAVAFRTWRIAPQCNGADGAVHRFFQRHHEDGFHVLALFRFGLRKTAAAAAGVEALRPAKKLLEEIAEAGATELEAFPARLAGPPSMGPVG